MQTTFNHFSLQDQNKVEQGLFYKCLISKSVNIKCNYQSQYLLEFIEKKPF